MLAKFISVVFLPPIEISLDLQEPALTPLLQEKKIKIE